MTDARCFRPWSEDVRPSAVLPCDDCVLARPGSRIIWGEGNPDADIWILLDNPGMREDKDAVPFVCGTRQTLHAAAAEFGFSEHDLYVTYVVRRRPVGKYPKDTERSTCIRNFYGQLTDVRPNIVFAMGDVALSALVGMDTHVKDMRGQIHAWNHRILVATYHPLAVRRRPNLMRQWMDDWQLLKGSRC